MNKTTQPKHDNKLPLKQRITSLLLSLYGFTLAAYFILHWFFGDNFKLAAFAANFVPITLFPVLVTLPIALKKRDWFLLAWSSFALLYFLVDFGPRFIQRDPQPCSIPAYTLRILSHNVGQDLPTPDSINNLIRKSHADLVILQEVTGYYIEHHWPDLLDLYPYQQHGPLLSEKQVGMGILSRYPITASQDFKLADKGLVFQQRLLLRVHNEALVIYNVHTTFPWINIERDPLFAQLSWPVYDDLVRHEEIGYLVHRVQNEQAPTILVGDFNLTDQSDDYRMLTDHLIDSYRSAGYGFGFTWPANRTPSLYIPFATPITRLDYIFHTGDFHATNAQVLNATGSDHLPLLVSVGRGCK